MPGKAPQATGQNECRRTILNPHANCFRLHLRMQYLQWAGDGLRRAVEVGFGRFPDVGFRPAAQGILPRRQIKGRQIKGTKTDKGDRFR